MSKSSILTVLLILALAIWLLSIGLFLELSQYDPYSWAFPGKESDVSRSLFLARRDLYVRIGIVSFVIACVLGGVKIFLRRRPRTSGAGSAL
jgi:hypothetical protein